MVYALACALAPPAVDACAALADPEGAGLLGSLGRHSGLLFAGALVCLVAGVLVYERPRAAGPGAYLAQLTDRWTDTTKRYDAELRRLEERHER